jgi:hypothetical protein
VDAEPINYLTPITSMFLHGSWAHILGNALRLNPHLHVVFVDGAYHEQDAVLAWQALGHLQTREVGQVLQRVVGRIDKHLRRHGLLEGFDPNAWTKSKKFRMLT